MGGYLSQPITDKQSEDQQNEKLAYGASSMQGWRNTQEDAHNCMLDFDDEASFFGVYDGHFFADVAMYTSEKLPEFVKNNEQYKAGNYEKALASAFLDFDDFLRSREAAERLYQLRNIAQEKDEIAEKSIYKSEDEDKPWRNPPRMIKPPPNFENEIPEVRGGCTAVVALIKNDTLYVANVGDSRCVISRNGEAVVMSEDHKPLDELERARIEKAGGYVSYQNRVDGNLNMSRALGDHRYKRSTTLSNVEQKIIALPDVRICKLDGIEFIVLACDGIWDFMSNQEVVDFVRPRIESGQKLSTICEELFDTLLGKSSKDNMTSIIVQIRRKNANNAKTTRWRGRSENVSTSSTEASSDGRSAPQLSSMLQFVGGHSNVMRPCQQLSFRVLQIFSRVPCAAGPLNLLMKRCIFRWNLPPLFKALR